MRTNTVSIELILGPCPKCGSYDDTLRFCKGERLCKALVSGEHLHRFCRTCRYDRTVPTLDSKQEVDT